MKIARNIIFLAHLSILILFICTHSFSHLQLLIVLVLHYLVLKNDSRCYKNHCTFPNTSKFQQKCLECNIAKWVRMRHCYKCESCIHKYDHHCVLIDICIGEFNHRFYLLFLIFFLWNVVKILVLLTFQMRDEVSINQLGVQSYTSWFYFYAILLLFVYFLLILAVYLLSYHIYLCSNNVTTWQNVKHDSISYLRYAKNQGDHPFSKGIIENLVELFRVDPQHPIDWVLPGSQQRMLDGKGGQQ